MVAGACFDRDEPDTRLFRFAFLGTESRLVAFAVESSEALLADPGTPAHQRPALIEMLAAGRAELADRVGQVVHAIERFGRFDPTDPIDAVALDVRPAPPVTTRALQPSPVRGKGRRRAKG
jgi:hypothetical protein